MAGTRPKTPQAVFTAVAPVYDAFNSVLSLGRARAWRETAARALTASGGRFLDVGTGTGRMAAAIQARSAGMPTAVGVVGCDLNRSMLLQARRRCPSLPLVTADAMRLPFADGAFDGAALAFALADMPDPDRCLRECARTVRPGGACVVLELSVPAGWMGRLYLRALGAATGVAARVTGADGLRTLPEELGGYLGPQWTRQTIARAGLELIHDRALDHGLARVYLARVLAARPAGPRSSP
jgi:demethylmenaquinone methyltransferase / 2-methoxy-6-polyprenyl-1,4-benzoquinol methylase